MSVSRLERVPSRVRRMSLAENKLKTSSVDSGSCQNCEGQHSSWIVQQRAYACPVRIIGGDGPGILKLEDALLKDELGLGGAHGGAARWRVR